MPRLIGTAAGLRGVDIEPESQLLQALDQGRILEPVRYASRIRLDPDNGYLVAARRFTGDETPLNKQGHEFHRSLWKGLDEGLTGCHHEIGPDRQWPSHLEVAAEGDDPVSTHLSGKAKPPPA